METNVTERKERIVIILDRLRSAYNVGNIFRIAEAVGAAEILCCGYTVFPPHPKLEKTAMGADKSVPFRHFDTSLDAVRALRKEGVKEILAVETLPGAPDVWDRSFEFPLALILGNEALGVHPETLKEVDGAVSLPMFGMKTSINVGNCAAVALYSVVAEIRAGGKKEKR